MKIRWFGLLGVLVLASAGIVSLLGGCDEAKGTSGLVLTPDEVDLTTGQRTQWFEVNTKTGQVGDLALPLTWSVSDPSLGRITQSSGYRALYERTDKNGVNTVIVRDQYENEGYASVNQGAEQYGIELDADPNPIPAGENTATVTVTGDDSVAPYKWWVRDTSLGRIISGGTSDTAVYQSTRPGVNVVHVSDANGVLGTVTITQE